VLAIFRDSVFIIIDAPHSAFEIKHFHRREPPPKEILEDVTPKGGDLLKRTIENFQPPPKKANLSIERTSTASGDEAGNAPNEEKMDICDPTDSGPGGVRTMRGEDSHG
jgi:chromatin structure-remodeling complex subunit RSC9